MVDRITPATTDADRAFLVQEYGLDDGWPVVTEPFRQWVIEDDFVAGRPPWEDLDVTVTRDVEPYELMKLRLLNAGHSTMAYLAALAGIEFVHEAVHDPQIGRFLRSFLEHEAGPVLPDIPGIDVEAYQAKLIERFSNPAIGDQISRLCLDGSAKFPKFLMPTVRPGARRVVPVPDRDRRRRPPHFACVRPRLGQRPLVCGEVGVGAGGLPRIQARLR
jgi:mannitol 2-dehydrogenase